MKAHTLHHPTVHCCLSAVGLALLTSCQPAQQADSIADVPTSVEAVWFDEPPSIEAAEWSSVPAYRMALSLDRSVAGERVQQPGLVQLACTDELFLLRVEMEDRDLVTLGKKDQDDLYKIGDVIEWFIGLPPRRATHGDLAAVSPNDQLPSVYIEMHVAPNGLRTAYRFARPGLIETIEDLPFTATVLTSGSLNNAGDTDQGWAVLYALSRDSLAKLLSIDDDPLLMNTALTILVGRYNYDRHLAYKRGADAQPELTMWPAQPRTRFHLRDSHITFRPNPAK